MKFDQTELRVLGLSAPTILKMLREREARVLGKIYGEIRNGKPDQAMALAEFACIRDLINEITSALQQHNAHEEKTHATADADHGNAD